MIKIGIIILVLLFGFMCYALMANASRISRMEEQYLKELEQKRKENLKK